MWSFSVRLTATGLSMTKYSILDVAAALDPPLILYSLAGAYIVELT